MTDTSDRMPITEAKQFLTDMVQKVFGTVPQVDCDTRRAPEPPFFKAAWSTTDKQAMNNLSIEVRKIFGKSVQIALHAGQATLEIAQTPAAMLAAIDQYRHPI